MEEIFGRRSVRRFLDKPVENEKLEKLLRAAMQAPSAGNQQPWEFAVVRERAALDALSRMSPYAGPLAGAPLAVVLLGNTGRMKHPDFWQQDMGAAAENLLLEAVSLGLGAVWLGVYPAAERVEYVRRQLCAPENAVPFSVAAVGYPADAAANRFTDRYDAGRVHFEKY